MKNLITRSLTGILYIAVIIGGITLPHPAMWVLMALLVVLAIPEYHTMFSNLGIPKSNAVIAMDIIAGLAMISLPMFLLQDKPMVGILFGIFLIYMLARIVVSLYISDMKLSLKSIATSFTSLVYISLPLTIMGLIYVFPCGSWILLGMFIMIWSNDTGAYIVGSQIGKKRLFERLSPKKSWEGFWGGMAFTVVASIVYFLVVESELPNMSILKMAILGVTVSVFATWGDLFESMIKRAVGVKDSGNLLPGHGGILDRIDSLLAVAPAVALYLTILNL
jgi:phosphatidate cytidylyltransferase